MFTFLCQIDDDDPQPQITPPLSCRRISTQTPETQSSLRLPEIQYPIPPRISLTASFYSKRPLVEKEAVNNVYYASVLPPTEPACPNNFLQLAEILDKIILTKDDLQIKRGYDHVFREIVRQYYIECSATGELLMNCLNSYNLINQTTDQIRQNYQNRLDKQYEQIEVTINEKKKADS